VHIGSHSLSHYMTGHLPDPDLQAEIRDSKSALDDRLGFEVPYFAYPYGVRRYGAYSDRSEAAVRDAGYQCSCTSEIGRAAIGSGAWLLPRIPLVNADTALDARAKAAGAYDWVALAQRSFQSLFPNPHNPE
jgi:peptidoglycan/xylan/chitin deacetylase (PgdA/CDA1 family)